MHVLSTFAGACDVGLSAAALQEFASRWPCMGEQSSPTDFRGAVLFFTFDVRGDLVDVQGDDGLDPAAVAALCADARAHAIACGFSWVEIS